MHARNTHICALRHTRAHTHPHTPALMVARGLTWRHGQAVVYSSLEQNTARVAGVRAVELRLLMDSTGQEVGWAHRLVTCRQVLLFSSWDQPRNTVSSWPPRPCTLSPLRNFAPGMLSSCGGEAGWCLGPSPARAALHKCLLDEGTGHRGSPAPSGVAGLPGRTPPAPAPRVSQTPLVVGLIFPAVFSGTVEKDGVHFGTDLS